MENLKALMESKDLWVELKPGRPSYMVLKGSYGEKIHETFHMSRQGVRWRFQRLFNHVYVEAFLTILMIEKTLGTQLRDHAMRISKERYEVRREADGRAFGRPTQLSGRSRATLLGYTFGSCIWPRSSSSIVSAKGRGAVWTRPGNIPLPQIACGRKAQARLQAARLASVYGGSVPGNQRTPR